MITELAQAPDWASAGLIVLFLVGVAAGPYVTGRRQDRDDEDGQ